MNDSIVKGKWAEFKGEVQRLWGDVTHDDLESTKGNVKSISGLIQQKYGHKKDDYTQKFNDLVQKYSGAATVKTDEIKAELKNDQKNSGQH